MGARPPGEQAYHPPAEGEEVAGGPYRGLAAVGEERTARR